MKTKIRNQNPILRKGGHHGDARKEVQEHLDLDDLEKCVNCGSVNIVLHKIGNVEKVGEGFKFDEVRTEAVECLDCHHREAD